jgi:regulatory protein
MVEVTGLARRRGRPARIDVAFDGAEGLCLPEDVAAGLFVGRQLDEPELAALRAEGAYREALDIAMRYLAARPRSRSEVERRLGRLSPRPGRTAVDPAGARRALARLEELGLIDDDAFARWWIENRAAHRPLSARGLRYELGERGVSKELIDTALAGFDDDAAATDWARRRAARLVGLERTAFAAVVGAELQRKGFGHDTIRQALAEAWREREGAAEGEG